jgi:ABC-type glutathione transport system ATPase component
MFNESLSKLSDRLRTMQREAVLAMRGELSEEDNLIGKRTIVDLSEYLNTVDKLQAAGANAKRVWGGEMRQYEGRLFKCGDFEQQGSEEVTAKEKLITTEQTCMVRRSYFKACCEGKILLVIGQCGTGKTETCKDISNVLGKTCEVLSTNGLATIDASMRKLIEEVGAKQGVLIMDEFNRMPTHAQVSWFNACKEAKVFLIGTYDPFTADANEIHKDVMASAVKQYLTVPDFGKLVEHMLHF